jgi:O-antigen ligase
MWVAVALLTINELQNIRVFHRMVPFFPLAILLILAAYPRAALKSLRISLPLAAYVVWAAASYLWTIDHYGVVRHTVEFVAMAVTGTLIGAALDRRTLVRVFAIAARIMIVATTVSLAVAYHWATKPAVDGAPGWHGPFNHKNGLGFEMAIGILALWFERPRARHQRLWLIAAGALLIGSESGAGLAVVAIVIAVAVREAAVRHAVERSQRRALIAASWLLGLVGLGLAVTDFPAAVALLGKNSTLTGRTTIWKHVVHAIWSHPLLGVGYGGVWLSKGGPTAVLWQRIGFPVYEAHDAWLDLLLQVGIVGFLLVLATIVRALVRGWPGFRDGSLADRWAWLVLLAFLVDAAVESGPIVGTGIFTLAILVTLFEQRPPAWPPQRPDDLVARQPPTGGSVALFRWQQMLARGPASAGVSR